MASRTTLKVCTQVVCACWLWLKKCFQSLLCWLQAVRSEAGRCECRACPSSDDLGVGSGDSGGNSSSPAPNTVAAGTGLHGAFLLPPVDLELMLGSGVMEAGMLYEPALCFPPATLGLKDQPELVAAIEAALVEALRVALAPLATNPTAVALGITKVPMPQLLSIASVEDPGLVQLRHTVADVVSQFVLDSNGVRACGCGQTVRHGSPLSGQQGVLRLALC